MRRIGAARRRHRAGRADPAVRRRAASASASPSTPGAASPSSAASVTNTAALGRMLYTRLRLLLPGRRPRAARRHDRRHRADAAPQGRRAPPVDRRAGGAHAGDGVEIVKVAVRRASIIPARRGARLMTQRGQHDHRPRPLSHGRGVPVHARHVRHLPQPQERHRHPDVDRADAARREHQPRGVLAISSATSSGRCSPCSS